MRKIFLMALCVTFSLVSVAQTRIVKGAVLDKNENPVAGVTVKLAESDQSVQTAANGTFEIEVSSYARRISALKEGYITSTLEIDGSFLVFKLQVDKKYAENKAKAEEQARIAAEKEAEAKAKAEEQARIAAQKEAEAKAKAEKQARIAAQKEAEAKAKAEEKARIAAQNETETIARAERTLSTPTKVEKEKTKRTPNYLVKSSGYFSIVDASCLLDFETANNYVGVSYIGGYQIDGRHYMGVGVGVSVDPSLWKVEIDPVLAFDYFSILPRQKVLIPVSLYYRYNILPRRVTPFVACSVGGTFSTPVKAFMISTNDYIKYSSYDVFMEPQVGVDFHLKDKSSLYLSVGYNLYTSKRCDRFDTSVYPHQVGLSTYVNSAALKFHLGFTF